MNLRRARSGISRFIAGPVSSHQHQNEGNLMKTNLLVLLLVASRVLALGAPPRVAGAQPFGVSVEESAAIVAGWSVRKSIMNKPVFNEKGERVGVIHDII